MKRIGQAMKEYEYVNKKDGGGNREDSALDRWKPLSTQLLA